jgi:MFS family permease
MSPAMRWIDSVFPRRALFQEDRRLLHLTIGRLLGGMGFAVTIPFLSLYLHTERGVPMSAVGGIFFFAATTGAIAQLLVGDWTDRHGRKRMLVTAQTGRGFVFMCLAAAVVLRASPLWFGVLVCTSSFFGRMFDPPSGAMIADITHGEKRIEAYGVLRVGGNLGWAIGPALGGFLAALSYSSLFLVSAALMFLSAAFLAFKIEETAPHLVRRGGSVAGVGSSEVPGPALPPPGGGRFRLGDAAVALGDREFLRYCLTVLVLFVVMGQLVSTLSIYVVDWVGRTKAELGFLYSLNGLIVVFLQFPATRLFARIRMTTQLVIGSLLYTIGYGMMGFGSTFALLFTGMAVVTLGEITAMPASMNLVAAFSGASLRGRYMGTYGLFNSFGWSVGPLLGGILLDLARGRPELLWGIIGLVSIVAAVGFWNLRARLSPAMDLGIETREAGGAA